MLADQLKALAVQAPVLAYGLPSFEYPQFYRVSDKLSFSDDWETLSMNTYEKPGVADYVASQVRCASILQIEPGTHQQPYVNCVRVWVKPAVISAGLHVSDLTRLIQRRIQRRYEAG